MLKQMVPTCACGQIMYFPVGKTEFKCPQRKCGMKWEQRLDGYWASGSLTTSFTPIFSKPKLKRFNNFKKWERKNRGRKAGSRC